MPYERTIATVAAALSDVFGELDVWFDRRDDLRRYAPAAGGWSGDQVLEHVALTNHFLLLTLRKFVDVAGRRAARAAVPEGEGDLDRLRIIGQRGSFGWRRPDHMEPAGRPPAEVRLTLRRQRAECLDLLHRLRHGEGAFCRVTM